MDFDQHFDSTLVRPPREFADEFKGLGNHETTGAALLDGVTGSIQADRPNACLLKLIQDFIQVPFALRGTDVDIHLFRGERSPQEPLGSIVQAHFREGKPRPRAIDLQ